MIEYNGLIFAYLGPPNSVPQFPVFDAMALEEMTTVPYKAPFRCNWLQVLDAILDPLHTSFLHSRMNRVQFSEGFGEIGRLDFFDGLAFLVSEATVFKDDGIELTRTFD